MVLEHNRRSTRPRPLRVLLEMHHLEAVPVKQWSKKAESPPSTFRRTSRDIQTKFMRQSGSGSRSVGIGWEDMILPGIEDPTQLRGSTIRRIERVTPKVGKDRVCIFNVWLNEMEVRWKWHDVYLLRGLPNIDSPSLFPTPLLLYLRRPAVVP